MLPLSALTTHTRNTTTNQTRSSRNNNNDNTINTARGSTASSISESTALLPSRRRRTSASATAREPFPSVETAEDELDLILDTVVDNIVEVESDTEDEQRQASSIWFLGGLLPNMRIRYFHNSSEPILTAATTTGPRRRNASRSASDSMIQEETTMPDLNVYVRNASVSDDDNEDSSIPASSNTERIRRRMVRNENRQSSGSYSTFHEYERLNPAPQEELLEEGAGSTPITIDGPTGNTAGDGEHAPENVVNGEEGTNREEEEENNNNVTTNTDDSLDEEDWENILNTEDVTQLTTRLRCLFALLTCPIVPLAATLTLLLLWVLYSALLLDWGLPCDQPLRLYALLSAAMFAYTPHHRTVKRYLFGYWRERDGPVRPWKVRVYDQAYHAACLLWMYAGISWTTHAETCPITSPNLYKSTRIFVLVQTVFMSILVIPLLCLPCIYLWLVRQASVIANNRRERRKQRADPAKIMASFVEIDVHKEENQALLEGKECCICMSDYTEEIEEATAGVSVQGAASRAFAADTEAAEDAGIIQTQCGHLFHKACIATWLKTPYSGSCKCPLCREDLVPPDEAATAGDEENQSAIPQTDASTEDTDTTLLLQADTTRSDSTHALAVDLGAAA